MLMRLKRIRWWVKKDLLNDGNKHCCARGLRVFIAVVVGFQRNQCGQKAAALTFNTLLAFIPLLAIMFALLKGFGVHNTIEPMLLKHLSVGSEDVVTRIVEYINNTNVTRLGSFGLVVLVFTVLALISNIEKCFNSLWCVDETRSLFRRFADYFSVVTLGPLFLLAAISMNTSMRNQDIVQWILSKPVFGDLLLLLFSVLPFIVIWAAFIFLYLFIPNTKVNIGSATLGGISAGTLWLITQWGYVNFQYGVAKYNAIYGTMAALPIFMIWIYLSWMIALLGLQLCWAHQHRSQIGRLLWHGNATRWQPLQVLEMLLLVYNRFQRGVDCWPVEELIEQVRMPGEVAREVLKYLQHRGVVMVMCPESGDVDLVIPQVSAVTLVLEDVLMPPNEFDHLPHEVAVVALQLQQIRQRYINALNLSDLLDQSPEEKSS
ncbi:MAG: YihY/virulence factor BrkB family protein [Thermodesulfobacteriota bacterium]|nr:YihY/virulence factor BrkB family protein [Thermodesulfobacteriota bacterium]